MKSGFIVVGILLAISVIVAVGLRNRYKSELLAVQDLTTGLLYFMEEHEGRFPASQAEFVASGFVEQAADGAIVIRGRPESSYRQAYGYPIRDLPRFAVAWGTVMEGLTENERGRVVDSSGKLVELVKWPSSPPSGKEYSRMLLAASRAIRAKLAATQPDGA
jgi:hypothetical protein